MTIAQNAPSFEATDEELREALAAADLPSLIPALAYVTGDLSILRPEFRPNPLAIGVPQGGLTDEAQAAARTLALEVIGGLRDGTVTTAVPSKEDLREIIAFVTGGASDEYVPLLLEELNLHGEDRRAPGWSARDVSPDRLFSVVVIGAGMSGLLAAYRLKQAGVDFVILEKNADVGGTWLDNTYPGCRVDNPNHVYSYSFAQRDDWPSHFSAQPVLLDYFRWFADDSDLRDSIRFSTEVREARFDEELLRWRVVVRAEGGREEEIVADAVVSAVGQLNRPKIPDLPGRSDFSGPSFHSAEWDHSVELAGKRVAVIGTGASAAQFVPEIAEVASEVVVFQRTANWLAPTPNYHDAVPRALLWLFGVVPSYREWYRVWLFWRTADGMLPAFQVDPAWGQERSVSAANEMVRAMLTQYLELQFADAPELVESVVPDYPPAAKRIILDNGAWPSAIKRPNVTLVTSGIDRLTASGLRTTDGRTFEADAVIFGTGFQAEHFLTPMRVVGRAGADLHERWGGDARAYLGITVPGFPNLFLLYGPNTNIVVNGSTVYFAECEVHYVMQCLRFLLQEGVAAIDPRPEVHDEYNRRIDDGNRMMAWGAAHVNTWYRNAKGRIAQNWPFTMLEYWKQTREVDPSDYDLLRR